MTMTTVKSKTWLTIVVLVLLDETRPTLGRILLNRQGIIHRTYGSSFEACKMACYHRRQCRSISYLRWYAICEFYDTTRIVRQVPFKTRGASGVFNMNLNKTDDVLRRFKLLCGACGPNKDCYVDGEADGVCEINACGVAPYIVNAMRMGNASKVGSKIQFRCLSPFLGSLATIECGADGIWSHTNLSCTECQHPLIANGRVSMSRLDDVTIQGHVDCGQNYTLRQLDTPTCVSETGVWNESLNYACCAKQDDLPWKVIFRMNSGFDNAFAGAYRFGSSFVNGTFLEHCQYRDKDVFENWGRYLIERVKLELIKDEMIVAYMVFSGINTNERTWFSIDNLLESSWIDLIRMREMGMPVEMSYSGTEYDDMYQKFVAFDPSQKKPRSCDFGWMYITKSDGYPCGTTRNLTGLKIIYSTSSELAELREGSGMDYADRIEISVDIPQDAN